jgi:7-cyano-7-deazaguanine synthase
MIDLSKKENTKDSKAVVLFSGGMDSTTLLYYCLKVHKEVHTVIINYNQRHKKEIEHAKLIANKIGVTFTEINLVLPIFSGNPLVDKNSYVPKQSELKQSTTVVPLRNTFFLLHASAIATSIEAEDVYIGAVEDDQLSYPDCRPIFFNAFQNMLACQNNSVKINYPFVDWKKEKIVELGQKLEVPWELTWTCYEGEEKACGQCDSCFERIKAFKSNSITDPIIYR